MIRIGLDIGSTTAKTVAIDGNNNIIYSSYKRHNAQAKETVISSLEALAPLCEGQEVGLSVTGSLGMGLSEMYSLPFVQEVVAAAKTVKAFYPSAKSMIDIGGEDAKVVFFKDGEATDLRMNGNCAGGTGAFIDQMAIILGTTVESLNGLALNAQHVYPIASRCGVFCKTDIQNLIAKNVNRNDIAASIFHAVAVQTVTTLAHGYDIESPILFCGGPLTFIPALRKAFTDYLNIAETNIIVPGKGEMIPAIGTALSTQSSGTKETIQDVIRKFELPPVKPIKATSLPPIFSDKASYDGWLKRISRNKIGKSELKKGGQTAFVGIDSGSTTTKIVVTDENAQLLFSFYKNNNGNPTGTVKEGLELLRQECENKGTELKINGSCSTGYGEDLIKAAFRFNSNIIETIAHYTAARYLDKDVSFILDIGGQDMKAIFVNCGAIDRIEINEACSSGCGSFIETFAKSLGYTASEFSEKACRAKAPCDLGTRCTVFMNSKVKQALREGATVDDMAAGLAYSVVKNCLYKVLKLKDTSPLGKHIVVQGGTMRNDAIVRAIELLTGAEVSRCDHPELMGAFGCALYSIAHQSETAITLQEMIDSANYTTTQLNCHGCENKCLVQCYHFANNRRYYSGNRCEKVFNNSGTQGKKGENAYKKKNELLFSATNEIAEPKMTLGIPRVLNIFEEYPFWRTLFNECGIQTCLSDESNFADYEKSARLVMSDNICFPAKLVHSHIRNLQAKKVDRIFMPFVVFEQNRPNEQNSYNCPIVTGYSAVIKSVQQSETPIDSPAFSFKDNELLLRQCINYLSTLGIDKSTAKKATAKALSASEEFHLQMAEYNRRILREAKEKRQMAILLAGRPYHTDMLIQHKVSELLAGMGICVLTDDIARDTDISIADTHFLSQWAYPNRIMKAAKWCAEQGKEIQFIQLTSFGCGPDAFITDEIRNLLLRYHKPFTLLKLDDINNAGSMKLRVRSLIESLKLSEENTAEKNPDSFRTVPAFDKNCKNRKILIPYFTDFISPLIPSVLKIAGYDVVGLPMSDLRSCESGLKYANNEICYPATLIVGDIIKAFESGKYNPEKSAVAITQTGGQCRASNYLPLIKKALAEAGYTNVPVISFALGSSISNSQPGFKINWIKIMPIAIRTILFSDCISKFYHASSVRERTPGAAKYLKERYLNAGSELILSGKSNRLYQLIEEAAEKFNEICNETETYQKVGIVGEIYLKFNPFAQRNILQWLIEQKIEIAPPMLTDFFLQTFVNRKVKLESHLARKSFSDLLSGDLYKALKAQINKADKAASKFRHYTPFSDIFEEAAEAEKVITLNAQFGEGWLLPAEIISYLRQGIDNIISLQPFGCIANHIVSKGIEKRLKSIYPSLNLLSLDFDSGVSDVNIKNRLLLFIDKLYRA